MSDILAVKEDSKSSLAANTFALLEWAETVVNMQSILPQLSGCGSLKINWYIDNRILVDSLQSSKNVENKLLRIDLTVLNVMIERGESLMD